MKLTDEQWDEMSDLMLGITREFNEERDWYTCWSTSGWRMMSDEALRAILKKLDEYGGLER